MGTFRTRCAALFATGCLVTTGLVAFTVAPASAATTFTVDSADDSGAAVPANCTTPVPGACRFNDALAAAEAAGGAVTISLAAPGGVVNATGDSWNGGVGDSLVIEGNGQTLDNPNATQTVRSDSGDSLTIDNTIIKSGYTAIVSQPPLTLTNSTLVVVVSQSATAAQGVIADVDVTISNSTIVATNENDGDATGVQTDHGPISLTDSTVTVTSAAATAVAVGANAGSNTVTRSTVTASGASGTAIQGGEALTLVNSTVAGSTVNGINVEGTVTLVYSDIVGNAQNPNGYNLIALDLVTFGSVIAQPGPESVNCAVSNTTTSQGYNYSDDADSTSSCLLDNPSDRIGATNDPKLGALANNGGPTPTLLPLAGSPLIDAIPSPACQGGSAAGITTDQRGLPRPAISPGGVSLACDIGSVELQPLAPTPIAIQPAFTG